MLRTRKVLQRLERKSALPNVRINPLSFGLKTSVASVPSVAKAFWFFAFIPGFILSVLLIPASAGQAASPRVLASLEEKVERWDVEEAWKEAEVLLKTESRDPRVLEMAAQIAFHRGEYGEARKLIQ